MAYESEWDGFITQASSGVTEALYSAGVDCSLHDRCWQVEVPCVDELERE